jgi:hypothetical protein
LPTISRWCFLFGPVAGQQHNNGVAFSLGSVLRTHWWANGYIRSEINPWQPKLHNNNKCAYKKAEREALIPGQLKLNDKRLTKKQEFRILQFPVRLAFTMTINKAQGQSLSVAGVNLETSCFSHGQLYVPSSRVGTPKSLYVFAPAGQTKNVVYKKALE